MSKIAKIPVVVPSGVTITQENNAITVNGPKGTLAFVIPGGVVVTQTEDKLMIGRIADDGENISAFLGLTRALVANMVKGVSTGFEKKLELSGVGYRAQASGSDLQISVGFSHPVKIKSAGDVTFKVEENVISVMGIDKSKVGDIAAKIRAIRPPEPYKGKGISYVGERIRRKAGKAAKAVGGK